jgi:hypothetical protein
MPIDIDQLLDDMKNAATAIITKDVTTIRGFSNRQLNGIANQAALVATGIASGQITPATRDFFLDQIVELTQNFAESLVGLLMATIERVWNAIVNVIWQAISTATGINLGGFVGI